MNAAEQKEKNKHLTNMVSLYKNACSGINDKRYYYISENSRYADLTWDLSDYNKYDRALKRYNISFESVDEQYVEVVKLAALKMLIKQNKVGTIKDFVTCANTIIKSFIRAGYNSPQLLDTVALDKLLEEKKATSRYYQEEIINACIHLFNVLSDTDTASYDYVKEKQYLKKLSGDFYDHREEGVNKYIPDVFFDQIIYLAKRDLESTELKDTDRVFAGLLIILANTGMRIEECAMLEANKLEYIKLEAGEYAPILRFYTFKTTGAISDAVETSTYLFPDAEYAYKKVQEIVFDSIDNMSNGKLMKKCMLKYEGEHILSKYGNKKRYDIFSTEQKEKIKNDLKRFLFFNCEYSERIQGSNNFNEKLIQFFVRHYYDFRLDGLSDVDKMMMNYHVFESEVTYKKRTSRAFRTKLSFEKAKKIKFPYANAHSFRVTLCTKLLRRKVSVDVIMRQFNHLSIDMTFLYDRSESLRIALARTENIILSMEGKNGFIPDSNTKENAAILKKILDDKILRDNYNRIKAFIEKDSITIYKSLSDIISIARKYGLFIYENELGVCVSSFVNRLCDKRESFSSLEDNYDLIRNQVLNLRVLPALYNRFYEKVAIVEHNTLLADQDKSLRTEVSRERNALRTYTKENIKPLLDKLNKALIDEGEKRFLTKYYDLELVVENLSQFNKDVEIWIV
jgi:integrase